MEKETEHLLTEEIEDYKSLALSLPSYTLNQRQLCDLELILNQGFAPLSGFLNQADYYSVLEHSRLADGSLWPMPITLDVSAEWAKTLQPGDKLALRDPEGLLLAQLELTELWEVNAAQKAEEAQAVFGSQDLAHPGVRYLFQQTQGFYISGKLTGFSLPQHYDFFHLRHTPATLRQFFKQHAWDKVVAFQTRNPMHRAHQELTRLAAESTGARVLIHPVVGLTKPGDIEAYTRVRCYEQILKSYTPDSACLSLLPLAMRMAGPREALWHALIRKNYGCTHFIVGRDHAGPGKNSQGQDFYEAYAAQNLALEHQEEIGLQILPFQEMVYSQKQARYFAVDQFPKDEEPLRISGTELRERLEKHLDIPAWFSFPEVLQVLRQDYPPKHQQGLTLLFTGLPSSGKSTIANALALSLRELTGRPVTLLDGDVVRTELSKGLGFSREDRETNLRRVAFVAKEIAKHGGLVLCALVAPYAGVRAEFRAMAASSGGFMEIHVSTPLSVCEIRDRKGLYKKARAGHLPEFTGISDPYEAPENPELHLDTSLMQPQEVLQKLIQHLKNEGYLL